MRLRRLDLRRFGHFTGKIVDFGPRTDDKPDFHIVYGPNEAGKTTLMEAYLRLLYGFHPTKAEPYAFLHPAEALEIGGMLEMGGETREFVRVRRRSGSLLDGHGQVLPDTSIQAELAGLGQQDYRHLLCLDDETIERGGEDILRSQGEVGAMLFSAAAGLSGLETVLAAVRQEADAFHRRNARCELSQMQVRIRDIASQVRQLDVSSNRYRSLRLAHEHAVAEERALREQRDSLSSRERVLSALVDAHRLAARMRVLAEALAGQEDSTASADVDPALLDRIGEARAAASAMLEDCDGRLAGLRQALAQLPETPLARLADRLQGFDGLRSRAETASLDLPRRRAEREKLRAGLDGVISGMGATSWRPDGLAQVKALLIVLRASAERLAAAEAALRTAVREEEAARQRLAMAGAEEAAIRNELESMPDTGTILAEHDGEALLTSLQEGQADLARARNDLAARMREVHRVGLGDRLPEPPVSPETAAASVAGHAEARRRLDACEKSLARAEAVRNAAARRLDTLRETIPGVGELETGQVRARRDAAWQEHRHALTDETADRFEQAMAQDDRAIAMRLEQAGAIAQWREARLALDQAEVALDTEHREIALVRQAEQQAGRTIAAWLAACGLDSDFPFAEFPAWIAACVRAHAARSALEAAQSRLRPLEKSAEALIADLRRIAGMVENEDELPVAVRRSVRAAKLRESRCAVLEARGAASTRARLELEGRTADLVATRAELAEIRERTDRELALHLDAQTARIPFTTLTGGLDSAREMLERIGDLDTRIEAMERDSEAFATAMTELVAGLDGFRGFEPLQTWQLLRAEVDSALAIQAERLRLEAELQAAGDRRQEAAARIRALDDEIGQLWRAVQPAGDPGDLTGLRQAMAKIREVRAVRDRIGEYREQIADRLMAAGLTDPQAALAGTSAEAAVHELGDLVQRLAETADRCDRAIAVRAAAEQELQRVQGEGDVAELVAERRGIEAGMEAGVLRYLENRLGLSLAEQALRRYRERHRSQMLEEAEMAFGLLTGGTYDRLSTQADGAAEILVAHRAADRQARLARQMSKGTRFQLYLALRAAAQHQLVAQGVNLPFFCDDIFETFDEQRTLAACLLMRRIGEQGQAIYLTHHAHVLEIAKAACPDAVSVHHLAGRG